MTKIFINYLTGDGEMVAAMLDRHLSDRFDSEVIFRASKSIPLGDDFRTALLEAARSSDALLAIIGARWLSGESGRRRIDQENNWTRREIIEAFKHDVRVIPILVGQVDRLAEDKLPPALGRLVVCQYLRLRSDSATDDLDRLASELARLVPGITEKTSGAAAAPTSPPFAGAPINGNFTGANVQASKVVGGNETNYHGGPR